MQQPFNYCVANVLHSLSFGQIVINQYFKYNNFLPAGWMNTVDSIALTIYNSLGQEVMARDYDSSTNGIISLTDIDRLSKGVYILEISTGDERVTRRFIKK